VLAELYHAHHSLYNEDLPFWLGLAAERDGAVLELGCGTGRVLVPLAEAGHAVWGLDRDAAMLAVLQAQLDAALRQRVNIVEGDIAGFDLGFQFPLILLPCNTYNTLNHEKRLETLLSVQKHLKEGGVFAFSMPNPELLDEQFDAGSYLEEIIAHPASGGPVQVSSECADVADGIQVSWHYDHLLPDGNVRRQTMTVTYRNASAGTYFEELTQSGFVVQAKYGDFDRSPYKIDSPYLILLAARE
jgi:SAM-dependent methyltransferase